MKYKEDDQIVCGECGRKQEDPVQDYVVSGVLGIDSISEDQCGWCGWEFMVLRTEDGDYEVEEI